MYEYKGKKVRADVELEMLLSIEYKEAQKNLNTITYKIDARKKKR